MRVLRTYARTYATNLDEVLTPLSRISGEPVGGRLPMANGLQLAAVGRVLVVAGDEATLAPFRSTQATLIVDDLDECQSLLANVGATVLRGPEPVPTGRNLTAQLPGGTRIEYVEWDSAQWDRVGGQDS